MNIFKDSLFCILLVTEANKNKKKNNQKKEILKVTVGLSLLSATEK